MLKYVDKDRMHELQTELTESATADTLTADRLSEVVRLYHDDRHYRVQSVGMSWILDHLVLFAKAVGDVAQFLRRHLTDQDCMERVLQNTNVLLLIPEAERSQFVFDAYQPFGSYSNDEWVKYTVRAGVPWPVLAAAVEKRIENAPAEDPDHNCYTPMLEFLEGTEEADWKDPATGRVWPIDMMEGLSYKDRVNMSGWSGETEWELFDEEGFARIIRLCVERAPHRVLEARAQISIKLPPETVQQLCIEAADRINRLPRKNPTLRLLPVDTRFKLAQRLDLGNTLLYNSAADGFLVALLIDAGYEASHRMFCDLRSQFDKLDAASVYRTAQPYLKKAKDQKLAGKVKELLRYRLEEAGYAIGTIVAGKHKQSIQWQVAYNGITYVHERNVHRYYPSEGDEVIFKPTEGRHLTPWVKVIYFRPVDMGKER